MSFFARNSALRELAALDDSRLADLGLTRGDIEVARFQGRAAMAYLAGVRDERASAWLR